MPPVEPKFDLSLLDPVKALAEEVLSGRLAQGSAEHSAASSFNEWPSLQQQLFLQELLDSAQTPRGAAALNRATLTTLAERLDLDSRMNSEVLALTPRNLGEGERDGELVVEMHKHTHTNTLARVLPSLPLYLSSDSQMPPSCADSIQVVQAVPIRWTAGNPKVGGLVRVEPRPHEICEAIVSSADGVQSKRS